MKGIYFFFFLIIYTIAEPNTEIINIEVNGYEDQYIGKSNGVLVLPTNYYDSSNLLKFQILNKNLFSLWI